MRRVTVITLLLAGLCLAGCSSASSKGTSRVVDLVGGPAAYDLVSGKTPASSIQAWRIDGETFLKGTKPGKALHGFAVISGPVDVDAASAATLSDAVSTDGTYLWNIAKACEFLPGVAVRWTAGDREVDLLICFSCDEVEFFHDGAKAGHEDMDPRRGDLVRVAKSLFPDDKAIQSLKP
ncbi:MAG: hypothetical protein ACYTDX_03045 [Planctomycetota bacterium]